MAIPILKTVLLIATLDTKGEEAAYLRGAIERLGKKVLVLDPGMRGDTKECVPEINRSRVAAAAGCSYEEVLHEPRHRAVEIMTAGTAALVKQLYAERAFQGVIALGGFDGSLMATAAMRELPIGVPKLMVSAMACGRMQFGEYVGTKDVMILPSVTDLLGVNEITCKLLRNAAGAISGMIDAGVEAEITGKNLVAATVFGQTTPAAMTGKAFLEAAGLNLVAFHPNGAGGAAMEELIRRKAFSGVWDLTLQELSDQVVMHRFAGGEHRLEAAGEMGLPQIVVPGCVDFVWGPPEAMRERFDKRLAYLFNRSVLLVKLSSEEIRSAARLIASKLNCARGPVAVMLPLRGVSMFDFPGGPFVQPALNQALFEELKSRLRPSIPVREIDAHINDPIFASSCVSRLIELIGPSEPVKQR